MRKETLTALGWGLLCAVILSFLIVIGSRNLSHFDAALVGYTFAVLFAVFGIVYRYSMWLQRPPTAMYWKRGWQVFLARKFFISNMGNWVKRIVQDFALNRFILRRGKHRWLAHWLIMWGCLLAGAITIPLVFGWLHFESLPENIESYRVFVFGFPAGNFPLDSPVAFLIFHGLVWSAFMVIPGVMLAMRRRMREEGAAALQSFSEDIMPLILLFAISLSGLLLTASYTWMKGYGYDFLSTLHAMTVIFTLLWLPFGKFFHIFQRPAQMGVTFYKDAGLRGEPALCRRCKSPFTSKMHVQDLIEVERKLGFTYEIEGESEHYQWICPPCRRSILVLAQGRLWRSSEVSEEPTSSAPSFSNQGLGSGPLGEEDKSNFHP